MTRDPLYTEHIRTTRAVRTRGWCKAVLNLGGELVEVFDVRMVAK